MLAAVSAPIACGDNDVTTLTGETGSEIDEGSVPAPAAEASRTLDVLTAPGSLDAVCRFIGVASVSGTGTGDRQACSEVVDECRGNVAAVLGAGPAPALPQANLELLLGCPLTLLELDACIAAALDRGIVAYGSAVGCDMPALTAVDPIRLFASPDCIAVVLKCPALIATLAPTL
jgi:hypothetical protein